MFSVIVTDGELMSCPSLPNPDNGNVTVTDSTASYRCNPGYTLSVEDDRTCDFSTGIWSGVDPVCLRKLLLTFVP